MSIVRSLPHVLTLARIPLGMTLPFLASSPAWFTGVLALALATDVADGRLARRLGVAGPAGARLDSASDVVLYLGAVAGAVLVVPASARPSLMLTIAAVVTVRLSAFVTARLRFGRWASIHTWANRGAGAVAGAAVLVIVWTGEAPGWLVAVAGTIAGASALEELWIVSTSAVLDPDLRGSWSSRDDGAR